MFQEHYPALVAAYAASLGAWFTARRRMPATWPPRSAAVFERPWNEFAFALAGAAGILGMGQLWSRGVRLPEGGDVGPLLGSINQLLIFAPILLVIVIRRHPWSSAWLPPGRVPVRLLVGLAIASLAVTIYSVLRHDADAPWILLARIWRYDNMDKMTQVFLEDVTIAILFVRLAGAVGRRWATVVVACMFAAGHIPVMVSRGATWTELAGLLLDAGLGIAIILVLQRSRDVIWFWCVHFCLDMTQFARISGTG